MAIICPTVTPTTANPQEYYDQLERVSSLSRRIQVDCMDGDFASPRSIGLAQTWWPEQLMVDLHMMYRQPLNYIETIVSLQPSLTIVHAEASGDIGGMMRHLQSLNMRCGVALLQATSVHSVQALIEVADHVLIFGGSLGTFGGQADLMQLKKVDAIRAIKADCEIGWDGGANETNVVQLAEAGIDVINVGSAIQHADNPIEAYQHLTRLIS